MSDYFVCWSGRENGPYRDAQCLIREVGVYHDGTVWIAVSDAFPNGKWDTLARNCSLWRLRIGGDVLLCRTTVTEVRAGLVRARVIGMVEPERVED